MVEAIAGLLAIVATFIAGAWYTTNKTRRANVASAKASARAQTELINARESSNLEAIDNALATELVDLTPLPLDRVAIDDAVAFFRGEPTKPESATLPKDKRGEG